MHTKIIFETELVAFLFMPCFDDFVAAHEGEETHLVGKYLKLCLQNNHIAGLDSVPVYLFDTVKRGLSHVLVRDAQKNAITRLQMIKQKLGLAEQMAFAA